MKVLVGTLFVVTRHLVRLDFEKGEESIYLRYSTAMEPAVRAADEKLVRARVTASGRVRDVTIVVHPKS